MGFAKLVNVVYTTLDQAIDGVKTFLKKSIFSQGAIFNASCDFNAGATFGTTAPTSITKPIGTFTTEIATCQFAINSSVGNNQSYADKTSLRVLGTTYTNTDGKPKFVSINSTHGASATTATLTISGLPIAVNYNDGSRKSCVSGVIPTGGTYSYTHPSGTGVVWYELS